VAREVEAALLKKGGDLLIRTKGILGFIPKGFKPDRIGIDSISSLYAAFAGQEENYRRYLTRLVEGLRKSGALSFLITESEQGLERYSRSGIEEFLADGVIVMYYVRKGSSRQRAIEVLKLRGAPHLNRIIPFNITRRGIVIRAEERVFE
jgi:KaiC/GvpD/RAD55 family RecA-like ATPase